MKNELEKLIKEYPQAEAAIRRAYQLGKDAKSKSEDEDDKSFLSHLNDMRDNIPPPDWDNASTMHRDF